MTDGRQDSQPATVVDDTNVEHIKTTYDDFIEKEIAAPIRAFGFDGKK